MTNAQSNCSACPFRISREKQLSIARHALAVIGTPEAMEYLKQMDILANRQEPMLCAPCEVSP